MDLPVNVLIGFSSLLIWVAGGAVCSILAPVQSLGSRAIYFAVGSYLCTLLKGWLLLFLAFNEIVALLAALSVGVLCRFLFKSFEVNEHSSQRRLSRLERSVSAILIGLLGTYCLQVALIPLQSWDALHLWGERAAAFLVDRNEFDGQHYENLSRHPMTVSLLLAWDAQGAFTVPFSSGGFSYVLACVSIVIALVSYGVLLSLPVIFGLILSYVAITTPLLENHVVGYGYADFWLAVTYVLVGIVFDLATRYRYLRHWLVFVLLLGCIASIKNSGPLHVIILIIGAFAAHLGKRGYAFVLLSSLFLILASVSIAPKVKILLLGNSWGFDLEQARLIMGGTYFDFGAASIPDALRSILHALLVKSSFSVLFVLSMLAAINFLVWDRSSRLGHLSLWLMLIFFIGTTFLFSSDYGRQHFLSGRDTALSRHLMPVALFSIVYCQRLLSLIVSRSERTES